MSGNQNNPMNGLTLALGDTNFIIGTTASFTSSAIPIAIEGRAHTFAANANVNLGTAGDVITGLAFVALPANKATVFVLYSNAAGVEQTAQGEVLPELGEVESVQRNLRQLAKLMLKRFQVGCESGDLAGAVRDFLGVDPQLLELGEHPPSDLLLVEAAQSRRHGVGQVEKARPEDRGLGDASRGDLAAEDELGLLEFDLELAEVGRRCFLPAPMGRDAVLVRWRVSRIRGRPAVFSGPALREHPLPDVGDVESVLVSPAPGRDRRAALGPAKRRASSLAMP